jgi:1-acyl-sn-glycerol-3-phosphate acyltransferase
MQSHPASLSDPKPRSEHIRPEITRLPELTLWRRAFRGVLVGILRLLIWPLIRLRVSGIENCPRQGPALAVTNHLGDADLVVGMVYSPVMVEALAKAELYDLPLIGRLMDAFGVIWVHRGQPDRRALHAALDGLREGRVVGIAPEGRESTTGALEEGTSGAAYLALRAGVPVLPVTFTGTENSHIYSNLKRLHRSEVTMTVGPLFYLDDLPDRKQALEQGTRKMMSRLAAQLPAAYQGIYRDFTDFTSSSGVNPE